MKIFVLLIGFLFAPLFIGAAATFIIARKIEALYPATGRFVEIDGGRLHYFDVGPDDPEAVLVFLHGASGNASDLMLPLAPQLSQRFRVLSFDRPGHGWSDRISGRDAASPAVQANLIVQALDRLGVKKAVFVGHSWAGALTANLGLDHADKVAGLVLLSPATHPWPGGLAWYYNPASAPVIGELMTWTITTPFGWAILDSAIRGVFAPLSPPPGYRQQARIPLALRPSTFRANAQDIAGLFDFVTAQSPRYANLTVPITIIAGDSDGIVYTGIHSEALAKAARNAKLIVLPGVGHMPHHAQPDLVAREIAALAVSAPERPILERSAPDR